MASERMVLRFDVEYRHNKREAGFEPATLRLWLDVEQNKI